MFTVSGQTIQYDRAWTHPDTGVQYPANWLRLASAAEKQAVGLVEVTATAASYNQRFYRGYDADGNLIPKTYNDLKANWIVKTKDTAYKLLQPSDYLWPKLQEKNSSFSAAKTAYNASPWSTWRSTIRTECQAMVTKIEDTSSISDTSPYADFGRVQALQEYIEGSNYNAWTPNPDDAADN
jgi:hypothetical protein